MNKKITKRIISIIFMVIFLSLFTACFSGLGADMGNLTINLGGNARSAIPWPPDGDPYILDQINYIITLTGAGPTQTIPAKGGGIIRANVSVGYWYVNVKAYWPDMDTLYAEGNGEVDVKVGQNNRVDITMNKAFSDDPVPDTYTVTFNSNGGTAVAQITGIASGATITAPTAPTKGSYGSFTGWYADEDLTEEWNFTDNTVTSNITLYAKWDAAYELGDTGPGLGIIFYRSETGFTMTDDNSTAYYLEATTSDYGRVGMSSIGTYTAILGTESGIGTGRKNTYLIFQHDPSSPMAAACSSYGSPGDWFIPSRDELEQFTIQRSYISDTFNSDGYWSSTETGTAGWFNWWNVSTGSGPGNLNSTSATTRLWPIRAF